MINKPTTRKEQEDIREILSELLVKPIETKYGFRPPIPTYQFEEDKLLLPFGYFMKKTNGEVEEYEKILNLNFIATLLEEQEIVCSDIIMNLLDYGSATLEAPTGFGKTIIGSYIFSQIGLPTLIITPITKTVEQWVETFQTTIGDVEEHIWVVPQRIPKKIPKDIWIIVAYIDRVPKIPIEFREIIKFIIIDEAHACCTPTSIYPLLYFQPKFILGETGTYEREDGLHRIMDLILGKNFIKVEPVVKWKFVICQSNILIEEKYNRDGTINYTCLMNDMCVNQEYLEFIVNIILGNLNHKFLVLTPRKDSCQILTQMLNEKKIICDYMAENKKDYIDGQVIVAMDTIAGVGFDEETGCDNWNGIRIDVVIRLGGGKNAAKFIQNVGRAQRAQQQGKEPIFVVIETKNSLIKNHWQKLIRVAKKRLGIVMTIPVNKPIKL